MVVNAAGIYDREVATLVFAKFPQAAKDGLRGLWADGGYAGALFDRVREYLDAILKIVAREPEQPGQHLISKRTPGSAPLKMQGVPCGRSGQAKITAPNPDD